MELVLEDAETYFVSPFSTITLCVPMLNFEAEYFAMPFELVLALTVLNFLPVKIFSFNFTPDIAFLVFVLITFVWKYFPEE